MLETEVSEISHRLIPRNFHMTLISDRVSNASLKLLPLGRNGIRATKGTFNWILNSELFGEFLFQNVQKALSQHNEKLNWEDSAFEFTLVDVASKSNISFSKCD